jgi:hypothetical protein
MNGTTTRRPYDLELREHRSALYTTHKTMNDGAAAALEWLLTVRGGLSAQRALSLASAERDEAMRMLVRCWFVPEIRTSQASALGGTVRTGAPSLARLAEILAADGVPTAETTTWLHLAEPLLTTPIRPEATWVDRRSVYDAHAAALSLSQEAIDDILVESNLLPMLLSLRSKRAMDCVQAASLWLSRRLGAGTGADFATLANVYERIADAAERLETAPPYTALVAHLEDDPLVKLKAPGHRSATIARLSALRAGELAESTWAGADGKRSFAEQARMDAATCRAKVGSKGPRPWSDAYAKLSASKTSIPFQGSERAHLAEYVAMLDLAARRLSQQHSAMANAERDRIERTATRQAALEAMPADARAWIERYRRERGSELGVEDVRIDVRTIRGWRKVMTAWKTCVESSERISALAPLQAERAIGDVNLFRALANDDAAQLREHPESLEAFAAVEWREPLAPAIRMIDAHRSPVWIEYGTSRLKIVHGEKHLVLETLDAGRPVNVTVMPKSTRYTTDFVRFEGENPNVPRADSFTHLRVTTPVTSQQRITNGRLVADRDKLASLADLPDEDRLAAVARLPWRLTYSAELPQTPIDTRLIERLRALKGGKGQRRENFANIPGLRVLGVDLGLRHAAACAVIELAATNDLAVQYPDADLTGSHALLPRSGAKPLQARRVGERESAAPWAVFEQAWHLRLPGESRGDRARCTPAARERLAEIAAPFGQLSERGTHLDTVRAVARLVIGALRANNALARRLAHASSPEQRIDLLEWSRREHLDLRPFVHAGSTDAELRALAESATWADAKAAFERLWTARHTRIRAALRGLRIYLREGHRGLGGLSLDRYDLLDTLYRLQRSHYAQPTPAEPIGRPVPVLFAKKLAEKRRALATERVRLIAHGVVAAALGGRRDGSCTPKTREHTPCQIVSLEDLTSLRTTRGNAQRRNRQIAILAPAEIERIVRDMCELHGLFLVTTRAAYTSRRDAWTGEPGILVNYVPVWPIVDETFRPRGEAAKRVVAAVRSRYDARTERYTDPLSNTWGRKERTQPPAVLVPMEFGPIFVTALGGGIDADKNAAYNIALEPLTDSRWDGAWLDIPIDRKGTSTLPGFAISLDDVSAPTRAWLTSDGRWQPTNVFWREVEENIMSRFA